MATRKNLIKGLEDIAQYDKIISESKLTVVDFGAVWCGPCKRIAPMVTELATENEECNFIMIDIDNAAQISEVEQISCVPTFVFYKNGKEVGRFSGADGELLLQNIEKHK